MKADTCRIRNVFSTGSDIVNLKVFKSMRQYSEHMSTGLDPEGTGTSLCYSGVGAVLKMYQMAFNSSSPVVLGILTSCGFL